MDDIHTIELLSLALTMYSAGLAIFLSKPAKEILTLISPRDLKWLEYLTYCMMFNLSAEAISIYVPELLGPVSVGIEVFIPASRLLLVIILDVLLIGFASKFRFLKKFGMCRNFKKDRLQLLENAFK